MQKHIYMSTHQFLFYENKQTNKQNAQCYTDQNVEKISHTKTTETRTFRLDKDLCFWFLYENKCNVREEQSAQHLCNGISKSLLVWPWPGVLSDPSSALSVHCPDGQEELTSERSD